MVTVRVVLKGVYSTPCQIFSVQPNDLKFGMNDNVSGYPNPAKFGFDWTSGGASTWWWHIRVLWLLLLLFFFSRDRVPSKPVNRFWRTIAQKTRYGARMCLLGVRKSSFVNLRVFCPKNPLKIARNRDFPAKTKTSNNFETPQDRQKMSLDHEYKTGVSLSESIFENVPGRPLAEIQRWRHLRHSQKPHYLANGTW